MKYQYSAFVADCVSTKSITLLAAVGYEKLKAVCLANIASDKLCGESVDSLPFEVLAKLTDVDIDVLKQMYKSIEYKFRIITANGWDCPS
jgi:hypothetical protein